MDTSLKLEFEDGLFAKRLIINDIGVGVEGPEAGNNEVLGQKRQNRGAVTKTQLLRRLNRIDFLRGVMTFN